MIMSNKTLSGIYGLIGLAALCLSSCGIYLGPGQTASIAHLETPAYRGEDVSANYISGSITLGNQYNEGDKNAFGSLSFHRSNAFSTGSISYGAFGYAGRYSFSPNGDSLLSTLESKSYSGLGLMFSSNVYLIGRKKVDWDALKFSIRFYNELGEYPQLKRDLISKHDKYTDLYIRHNSIVDMGLSTGMKIRHGHIAATSINFGITMHALSRECRINCYSRPITLGSLNFQFAHSFSKVPITLHFLLASNAGWGDSPILSLNVGYRFGDKKRKTETIN